MSRDGRDESRRRFLAIYRRSSRLVFPFLPYSPYLYLAVQSLSYPSSLFSTPTSETRSLLVSLVLSGISITLFPSLSPSSPSSTCLAWPLRHHHHLQIRIAMATTPSTSRTTGRKSCADLQTRFDAPKPSRIRKARRLGGGTRCWTLRTATWRGTGHRGYR